MSPEEERSIAGWVEGRDLPTGDWEGGWMGHGRNLEAILFSRRKVSLSYDDGGDRHDT